MLVVSTIEPIKGIFYILIAYVTLFGIAALGYFINDWADIKSDQKAGKSNKLGEYGLGARWAILLLLLIISFSPWVFLPFDKISGGLIGIEILLFMVYSLPPFRLKERGFWGVICDALYAYAVPAILASYTFYLLGEATYFMFYTFLFLLIPWLLCIGIRGILLHQLQDYSNDILSDTKTFTILVGADRVRRIVRVFLPIEMAMMLLLFTVTFPSFYLLLPGYIVFFILTYLMLKKQNAKSIFFDPRGFSYKFYDDFYLDVLPILILTHLCMIDWIFCLILLIHVLIFRNIIKNLMKKLMR